MRATGELLHERPVGLVDAACDAELSQSVIVELRGDMPAGGKRGLALEESHLGLLVFERHARCRHAQPDEVCTHGRFDDMEDLCKSARQAARHLTPWQADHEADG